MSSQFLESIFDSQRCDSQFAYFCFFVLLVFLAYTFAEGVRDELNNRMAEAELLELKQRQRSNTGKP